MLDRRKDAWKWSVGIILSICLGVSGWLFGALQSANAQTHEQLSSKVESSDQMTRSFMDKVNIDIAEMKTDLKYIKEIVKNFTGAN